MAFVDTYVAFLQRFKTLVIIFWVAVTAASGIWGFQFMKATTVADVPPPGSASAAARAVFTANFEVQGFQQSSIILMRALHGSVLTNTTYNITMTLANACKNYPVPNVFQSVQGYWVMVAEQPLLEPLARSFVTSDEKSTIIQFDYSMKDFNKMMDFVHFIEAQLDKLRRPHELEMGLTGQQALFDDAQNESESDFLRMDSIVIPCALIVFSVYLRNLRLILIPLLSVGVSVLTAFLIMWPVALHLFNVASFTPSIMLSISLAMSIDYCLFLLSRFREEVTHGRSTPVAVRRMLQHAGKVVLLSGSTLAVTFLGLFFFPLNFVQSQGLGASVSLVLTIIVNLTLVPAVLLQFDPFFRAFDYLGLPACCWMSREQREALAAERASAQASSSGVPNYLLSANGYADDQQQSAGGKRSHSGHSNHSGHGGHGGHGMASGPSDLSRGLLSVAGGDGLTPSGSVMEAALARTAARGGGGGGGGPRTRAQREQELAQEQEKSYWFKCGSFVTRPRYAFLTLLVVLGATLPIAVNVLHIKTTVDNELVFPRDSGALHTFQELQQDFSAGMILPYSVIATTPGRHGAWSAHYFELSARLAQRLEAVASQCCNGTLNIISPSYVQFGAIGVPINYSIATVAFDTHSPWYPTLPAQLFRRYIGSLTNADNSSALLNVVPSFDPEGQFARPFVYAARDVLNEFTAANPGYAFYLAGGATLDIDAMDKVNELFPIMIATTVGVVFLVVAVIFKSVFVPIRLLVTIALGICWVYGLADLIFNKGVWWVDDMFPALKKRGLFWLELPMTLSILVGLGLDYDVFLFSRVIEYRRLGYTTRAAAIKGVHKTGSIISSAGLIMALAFGGLMASHTMVLTQFGMILAFSVLLDTFVIRVLLVPALVSLAGELNWWPGSSSLPSAKFDTESFLELRDVGHARGGGGGQMSHAGDLMGDADGEDEDDAGGAASGHAHRRLNGQPVPDVFGGDEEGDGFDQQQPLTNEQGLALAVDDDDNDSSASFY